eukprot:gnl/MRDRNA2_/MRDRNA2_91330_c0_seq1.p1 gnl/MRDRNA2_/MRDRNA2_91330_c0~~gnl/MRDRNA2_/MRDRNA2_91330_c0_seq1.p1  ORF type:complete len:519 (+),score=130.93 gnl/MRDRNA2_/MRDRNA2_91330_c0_seq1:85-1641(+)
MPRTPGNGKSGEHRSGAVVLTPARSSAGSASPKGSPKGFGRDSLLTPNSKASKALESEKERCHENREIGDEKKGGKSQGHGKGDASAKGQAKGKAKSASKISETPPVQEAKTSGSQPPRVRDEIQEEVDVIISMNSNLLKSDFDGRVFQYLHAIHGVGGQEKVRKALETIHKSTLQKQRASVKKWPAYIATLLKSFFDNLGAEKKEERDRAKVTAETYAKELSISVDALFKKPGELGKGGKGASSSGPADHTRSQDPGNPAANPQEAANPAADPQGPSTEWLKQAVTDEREQQWLRRGHDLLSSLTSDPTSPGMPKSPIATRSIPPGFTPPQVPSPSHANSPVHGNMFGTAAGLLPAAPGYASTPPSQVMRSPPAFSPPPPPAPQLPLQPPPPPPMLSNVHDPFKQQPSAPPPPPLQQADVITSTEQQQGPPRVISPPAAPTIKTLQQSHQPRVVPPPQRRQQPYNAASAATAAARPPPPPPCAPPTDAPGAQLLPETSWTVKSARPPPWPAQYVSAA